MNCSNYFSNSRFMHNLMSYSELGGVEIKKDKDVCHKYMKIVKVNFKVVK